MSVPVRGLRPVTIARVVHDVRRRQVGRGRGVGGVREFKSGDAVRSLAIIENDGICPRKDFGETLVYQGDVGIIRDRWGFLGETYYTVEFAARSAVVILRGREMANAGRRGADRPLC
jgi:nitrogen fixation protein NifZ